MTRKNKFKIIDRSVHKVLFLSSAVEDLSWREELKRDDRRSEYMLWKLRKMRIMEIIVKIVATTWAFVCTVTSLITWMIRDNIWMIIFTTLTATAFWFILIKSAGSIELISVEIKDVKRELRKNEKK